MAKTIEMGVGIGFARPVLRAKTSAGLAVWHVASRRELVWGSGSMEPVKLLENCLGLAPVVARLLWIMP